jgi:hypothetical protein
MTYRLPSLLAGALLAIVAATTACTTVSDSTGFVGSAFAHPGTNQRFLLAYYSAYLPGADPYNGQPAKGTAPAYPDDLASPPTLGAWKRKFMPSSEPAVQSLYRNRRELGAGPPDYTFGRGGYFWRKMTCTKRFVRGGPGGCVVSNYRDDTFGPEDTSGDRNDGTVAMSITRDGFVHFSLYQPNNGGDPDIAPSTSLAALDDEGFKIAPHVCVNCHGGTIGENQDLLRKPDLGSVFREFEPSLLEAPPGITQAAAEQQWYELNQAVLAANATLRGENDGAIGGLELARKAVDDHIHDLYAGLGEPKSHSAPPFSRAANAPELVPPSWRKQDADSQALWSSLVNPYCMECHRHNGFDFSDYDNFEFLRPVTGGRSLLEQYVTDDGRGQSGLPYMPQAQAALAGLQLDVAAWSAIRSWSSLPASEAVVEIAADQPQWPFTMKVSTDTVVARRAGPMAIRVVNRSTHDVGIVTTDVLDRTKSIPGVRPGGSPTSVVFPAAFTGPAPGIPQVQFALNGAAPDGSASTTWITVKRAY